MPADDEKQLKELFARQRAERSGRMPSFEQTLAATEHRSAPRPLLLYAGLAAAAVLIAISLVFSTGSKSDQRAVTNSAAYTAAPLDFKKMNRSIDEYFANTKAVEWVSPTRFLLDGSLGTRSGKLEPENENFIN